MDEKVIKSKTPDQAIASLMRLCARREYSSFDARRLLVRWNVCREEHDRIVARLQKERFIDDGRYAEAFVREKIKLSRWGERKIVSALRAKRISGEIISEVLGQYISREESSERLYEALSRKLRTIKYKDIYDLRAKLMRYGAGLGHDFDAIADCIEKLTKELNNED